jgi:hypothetical protein
MIGPAQKIAASTQQFTEIEDIIDNIVILKGGSACLVIEITASNFALLAKRDQDTKIFAYAAFLNSLTFPVQILIRNKRVDISVYLKLLEEEEQKAQNQLLVRHIRLYREFIHEMVKINVVLNKTFYVILAYSSLEGGMSGAVPASKNATQKEVFVENAKKTLLGKADSVHSQLRRFAVETKTLEKEDLVRLFYDIFNENTEGEFSSAKIDEQTQTALVRAAPAQGGQQ